VISGAICAVLAIMSVSNYCGPGGINFVDVHHLLAIWQTKKAPLVIRHFFFYPGNFIVGSLSDFQSVKPGLSIGRQECQTMVEWFPAYMATDHCHAGKRRRNRLYAAILGLAEISCV
jgi:hypothetical protein